MEKLMKTARVLDVLTKILYIFCIVACCMLVAANIFMTWAVTALPAEKLPESLSLVFDFNDADFPIFEDGRLVVTKQQLAAYVIMLSLTEAISVVVLMIGAKLIRRILSPMKEGRPFEDGISKIIRNFGHFVLAATVICGFIEMLIFNILGMIGATPIGTPVEFSMDGIVAAVVIYLLSYIFRYGEELQKQADETL